MHRIEVFELSGFWTGAHDVIVRFQHAQSTITHWLKLDITKLWVGTLQTREACTY